MKLLTVNDIIRFDYSLLFSRFCGAFLYFLVQQQYPQLNWHLTDMFAAFEALH